MADANLEHTIRFGREVEFKNLFTWYIQELATDGRAIGQKQIPWEWRLNFVAAEAHLQSLIASEGGTNGQPPKQTRADTIHIVLKPYDPHGNVPSFSMFGTSRRIAQMTLTARSLADPSKPEGCSAWGFVRYTSDVDFREELVDDALGFDLALSADNFDVLRNVVRAAGSSTIRFSIMGVSGFYAPWSPGISTDEVKILANYNDQKVEGIEPRELPRLGNVADFTLRISQSNATDVEIFKENFAEDDSETSAPLGSDAERAASNDNVVAELRHVQKTMNRLAVPMWLLFFLTLATVLARH